jgi:lipopolysaccharide/colanic/teichoic acid biosynthesis glycosyltransferase
MGFGDVPIITEHIQTMIDPDVPLEHDKDEATPLIAAKWLRHLGLDSLLEISNVSLDATEPGAQAGVGPRPQMPRQIEIIDDMTRPNPSDRALFQTWREVTPRMLPGLWSTTSNIDDKYKPNTLEYHRACMEADIKYFHMANAQLDVAVFCQALRIGFERAQGPLPEEYLQALGT